MKNFSDGYFLQRFLQPRYWLTSSGLVLLRLIIFLPYRWQLSLGRWLGNMMYRLMKRRRHIASTNISLCFPELDGKTQQRLVREAFQSTAISLFETALSWWASDRRLAPLCHIDGLPYLQQALEKARQQGTGVILLSAHFTCLEIGGRLLALHQPFAVMYKKHRNVLFENVMKRARESQFQQAIPQEDIRGLLRALKQHLAVWYAPDQDLGRNRSVFAPFMGIQAATLTAPARLTRMSSALVVPFFPRRKNDDSGYELTLLPALEGFPVDDEVANASRINQLIEAQIRKAPAQYLWLHRRFKTRPDDEPSPYGLAK